jgi:hypothetical protein
MLLAVLRGGGGELAEHQRVAVLLEPNDVTGERDYFAMLGFDGESFTTSDLDATAAATRKREPRGPRPRRG